MGTRRKITPRAIAKLKRSVEKDSGTVTNALRREGLRWRRAMKTPLRKKKQLCDRKQFATEMLDKEDKYLDKISWSDESKIELFVNNYNVLA